MSHYKFIYYADERRMEYNRGEISPLYSVGARDWWITPTGAAVCVGSSGDEPRDDKSARAIQKAIAAVNDPARLVPVQESPVKVPGWLRYEFNGDNRRRYAYLPEEYGRYIPDTRKSVVLRLFFVEYGRGKVCPWSDCRAALVLACMSDITADNLYDVMAILPCYASDD